MAKPRATKIDKAIESIEQEIAVLQLAIVKLRQQQEPLAKPRPVRAANPGA